MSNDTQHYTNFEIFHSLVPKMKAVSPNITNWDELDKKENYDNYSYVIDAIATAYRSGYGRGQKGRSFLIGEKKIEDKPKYENTPSSAKKIVYVCWTGKGRGGSYVPSVVGTVGRLDFIDDDDNVWVFWPAGSCEVHYNELNRKSSWCCLKKDCVKVEPIEQYGDNIKDGDKIIYLGTVNEFDNDVNVWPSEVAIGTVNINMRNGGLVKWDNPDVVGKQFNGRSHVWYKDCMKVIPWD